jgi:hypothetical protein
LALRLAKPQGELQEHAVWRFIRGSRTARRSPAAVQLA